MTDNLSLLAGSVGKAKKGSGKKKNQ